MARVRRLPPLLPLAFVSGACALVYQIAWTRDFRLVFGASTLASAAVVAIFIGGLGLGAWRLGERVDRATRPLRAYALLELGIAASAAGTRVLLPLAMRLYVGLGGSVVLGLALATLVRLLLAALVLAVPTLLMGATLPALARAGVAATGDPGRRGVALLYGVNTLGAVAGCVLANFYLVEHVGTSRALLGAVAINLLVALTAWAMDRGRPEEPVTPDTPTDATNADAADAPLARPWFVYASAAIVGFVFFLMEMVFTRMLVPLLGGTIYTFGLVLAVALFGTGLGAALQALLARRAAHASMFAVTCALEALGLAGVYALGDRIAVLTIRLRPEGSPPMSGYVPGWLAITAIVVLPASLAAGVQFPLLVALLGRGKAHVARHLGITYAWNTLGAIAGALAGGFGLMVWLSATGCWRLAILLLVGLAAAATVPALSRGVRVLPLATSVVVTLGALGLVLGSTGPTAAWRHTPIGAGRVARSQVEDAQHVEAFLRDARRNIVWDADGIESTISIDSTDGYSFNTNGKCDGHCRVDAPTQVMGGVLAAILHPAPATALVIGLGSGSSARWLAQVPTMDRVDAVELEPAMLEVARRCASVNERALDNPKLHVVQGDAREVLSVTPQRYDVVFSEPSNPYRAGVASLYTREFYERIRGHLRPGGLLAQWVQAYEVDRATLRTVFATMASVFPDVETWQLEDSDLLLVASEQPVAKDVGTLRARIAQPVFAKALRVAWEVDDVEGLLGHFVARAEYARAVASQNTAPLNTDDRPVVEFGFAKALVRTSDDPTMADMDKVQTDGVARDADLPEVTGGDVDWNLVAMHRAEIPLLTAGMPYHLGHGDDEVRARLQFAREWKHRRWSEALAAWDERPREPWTRMEALLLADTAVTALDPRAPGWIDRIAISHPVEADALRAEWLVKTKQYADAIEPLERAARAYRTDPWPYNIVLERLPFTGALLATEGALAGHAELLPRIDAALSEPFVIDIANLQRIEDRALYVHLGEASPACADILAPLEPWFPWDESMLELRAKCYARTSGPASAVAQRELATFLAQKGTAKP
jgi:predicted membrane-bound spermidine synthase